MPRPPSLSGRTNPQHVLLAWNQNPSAKRGLTPLNSLPSQLSGQRICTVRWLAQLHGAASPARNGEEDAGLDSSPLPCSAGPGRITALEESEQLLQRQSTGEIAQGTSRFSRCLCTGRCLWRSPQNSLSPRAAREMLGKGAGDTLQCVAARIKPLLTR